MIKKSKLNKLVCYFFAVYLMIVFGIPKDINESGGVKEKLKELIVEKNNIKDLFHTLNNFDFYIGACGIEAQNLAIKLVEVGKKSLF